jgi:hypothetical protein
LKRFNLILSGIALAAGCGGATEPSIGFDGRYVLQTVNGKPLPSVKQSGQTTLETIADTIDVQSIDATRAEFRAATVVKTKITGFPDNVATNKTTWTASFSGNVAEWSIGRARFGSSTMVAYSLSGADSSTYARLR